MKREEAVEQLRNLKKANFYSSTIIALDMAIDALNQTAWIPVGEGLPENGFDDIVLVSIGYDIEFGRCNSNGEWLIWSFADWLPCDKVLAWMPLPEPYKGGDDSE